MGIHEFNDGLLKEWRERASKAERVSEVLAARVAELERERDELKAIVEQVEARGGKDGHIYYGPDCILCGHFGPTDAPEPCDAEKRFALLKRERDEADAMLECQIDGIPPCHGPGKQDSDMCRACLLSRCRRVERERDALLALVGQRCDGIECDHAAERDALKAALRAIAKYERPEVVYDQFAYERLRDAFRSVAREALGEVEP